MRKISLMAVIFSMLTLGSCNKNKCAQCHYDNNGAEVELGEFCGDDIENLEKNGHTVDGVNYPAHCGEH
jgi:hypothetical protein